MSKTPEVISFLLDFLSKKLETTAAFKEIKEVLGLESQDGSRRKMFYQVKCPVLGGVSLLQFIDSQSVRLNRQKEEMIDLSVKISNHNNPQDKRKAMDEVIACYKSGLPSSVGLRDMISSIKERYPWTRSRRSIMTLVSVVACILGIAFYVLDVVTDVVFSWEMLTKTNESRQLSDSEDPNIEDVNVSSCILDVALEKLGLSSRNANFSRLEECNYSNIYNMSKCPKTSWMRMFDYWERKHGHTGQYMDPDEYRMTGFIALWHCIQPWLITTICFFALIKTRPRSAGESWLVFLVSSLPIPLFSCVYRLCLQIRCYKARSQPDFKTRIMEVEDSIRKYEKIGRHLNYLLT